MALIALTSAKGSPGVTTTALALALVWPRPCLLLEADVAGSSSILAGYFHGEVPHDRGLIDLAAAHRDGDLAGGMHRASIPLPESNARVIPGLRTPTQAGTMLRIWEPIASVARGLESTGVDVLVDAGRAGAVGAPAPLVREADVALLVSRSDLPAVAAARALAQSMRDNLTERGADDSLRLLLVGDGRPFGKHEVGGVVGLPLTAVVPWDPAAAEILSLGKSPSSKKSWQSTKLVRGASTVAAAIDAAVAQRRGRLAPQHDRRTVTGNV